jgi:hypothetical protein
MSKWMRWACVLAVWAALVPAAGAAEQDRAARAAEREARQRRREARAAREEAGAARNDAPKAAKDGKAVAARLRAEWDTGTTRMMQLVIDECRFSPKLKASLATSVGKLLDQQDALIEKVEQDPSFESTARSRRAKLNAEFMDQMKVVYQDKALNKEFGRRMAAMEREIDDVAAGTERLLANLDAIGVSKEQRAAIKPLADEASTNVKNEVRKKSRTGSVKDPEARDAAVKTYKTTRQKIRQQLTPEQQEKLKEKLAG